MNDLLDDRLRTMMRTATADAPEAPSIDDLETLVSVGPEPRQQWTRPLTAVAAVVAIVAVGALAFLPSADDADIGPTDTTVPEVVAGTYLDAYYLPSALPDGWQIVEMNRSPAGAEYVATNAVVFERRDGSDRAIFLMSPTGPDGDEPTAATVAVDGDGEEPPVRAEAMEDEGQALPLLADGPATARWNDEADILTWDQDENPVWIRIRSRDEGAARGLAADLRPTVSPTGPSFDVTESSDWVKVREYQLNGRTLIDAGTNDMMLASDQGQTFHLVVYRPTGIDPLELALPVEGRPGLYRVRIDADTNDYARRDGDILLDSDLYDDQVADDETVTAILESMARVTEDEWLAARPDPNEVIGGATVVGTFQLLDHTITAHREGGFSGVCIKRSDGVSGCAVLPGVGLDGELPPAAPTQGIPLSDGTWVAVGSIANGLEPCDEPLLQGARAAVVPNGDVQTMLVVPADLAQSFACPLTGVGEGDVAPTEMFIANPPTRD